MWLLFSKQCLKWDEVRYGYSVFSGFICCQWEILHYICTGAYLYICLCLCVVRVFMSMLKFFSISSYFSLLHPGSVPNFTQNRLLVALLDHRVAKVLDRIPQIDNRFGCWWFLYNHNYYDAFVSCNDQHSVY